MAGITPFQIHDVPDLRRVTDEEGEPDAGQRQLHLAPARQVEDDDDNDGPYINRALSGDSAVGVLGKEVRLNCHVTNLGNRTVSKRKRWPCTHDKEAQHGLLSLDLVDAPPRPPPVDRRPVQVHPGQEVLPAPHPPHALLAAPDCGGKGLLNEQF